MMTTFNQFKFERVDGNSTLTLEVKADGCQEIVDEFISFMRGCGFIDVNIYDAMENAVEEHTSYQAHVEKDKVHLERAAKFSLHNLHVPIEG
jgi:hypothetical protein